MLRDRDEAIRASREPAFVLAERHGLSARSIDRIRVTVPRPLTRREEAQQVRAGAWRAKCMDDAEWARWTETNPIEGVQDSQIAPRPCTDCPLGFAAEMRAEARCNGSPGWEPPVTDEEVMAEGVLAVITGPTVSARTIEEEPVMEAAAAAPEPIEELPAETLGDTLAILVDAARIADEAWRRREEIAQAHADLTVRLRELEAEWAGARQALEAAWATTWLGFRHPLPDDLLRPLEELPRIAEQRHERLLHGERPDSSTADPQPMDRASVETTSEYAEAIPEREDDAPEVATAPAHHPAGVVPGTKQSKILAAVLRLQGDLKAAAFVCGTTSGNVTATLHNAGKRGLLTVDLLEVLPASFAKYSSVGR